MSSIKGKTTRRKPLPVVDNVIEIPNELLDIHRDVVLSVDGITVNGLNFFTTISHDIFFRTAQYVPSTHAVHYRECLDEIIAIYRGGSFDVTVIYCDNEFHKAFDGYAEAQTPPIKVGYSASQEHVPRAERNNRTIKERVRTGYHYLPFNHLPRTLVKIMVTESPRKLNYFPNKNGVSKYYSPSMIVAQENLDSDRHCKYACGDYVQAHEEPEHTNTNAARSLDCLYLRPAPKSQSGHELLHLQTNKIITRRNLTPVPITPSIINQVHKLAEMENMPKGLKVSNRTGLILFDSASIAGVDIEEELFDDDDEVEASDEDEDTEDIDANEIADLLQEQAIPIPDNNNIDADANNVDDEEETDDNIVDDEEEADNNGEEEEEQSDDNVDETDNNNYVEEVADEQPLQPAPRRSSRASKLSQDSIYIYFQAREENTEEYSDETAPVIAMIMCHINDKMAAMSGEEAYGFIQTYSLKAGLKKFGEKGSDAIERYSNPSCRVS